MQGKGVESDREVRRLTEEIADLTSQQMEALRNATYFGMTGNEAQEFDDRRQQIGTMMETLQRLRGTP